MTTSFLQPSFISSFLSFSIFNIVYSFFLSLVPGLQVIKQTNDHLFPIALTLLKDYFKKTVPGCFVSLFLSLR